MNADDLVIVGKLGRPRGVCGDIYVTPLTDFPTRFDGMVEIHVGSRDGWELKKLAAAVMVGGRPVLRFEGVDTPEEVARMTNRELAVPRDRLVELPENEYFVFDLIGCEVFEQENGERIGEVIDVEKYPANDVYVVTTANDKKLMVPVVGVYVKKVDIEARRIEIDPTGLDES